MAFDSIQYLFFLPCVVGLYWLLPHRLQNLLLLIASYYFYGSWSWKMLSLIALTSIFDFTMSQEIHLRRRKSWRKACLLLSLTVNFGVLAFFKYYNFFAADALSLLKMAGISVNVTVLEIILPVGISFYTFQSMSYVMDVYWKRVVPTPNLFDYLLYVSFFPQLVAGPIERAPHLLPQVHNRRRFNAAALEEGLGLIVLGLFKKLAVADHLGLLVDAGFDNQTGWKMVVTVYFFAFQIYCDFSAYTDIARGSAKLLGFDLCRNFDRPYLAGSLTEFWRRWHMSLSTWFRDYVYVPLGGSRAGLNKHLRNLMVTFLLSGLWHGANWTFVIWGGFHGLLLSVETVATRLVPGGAALFRGRVGRVVAIVLTFHLVCAGWVFFRAPSLTAALSAFERMAQSSLRQFADYGVLAHALVGMSLLLLFELAAPKLVAWQRHSLLRLVGYPVTVIFILVWGQMNGGQFIYFQF